MKFGTEYRVTHPAIRKPSIRDLEWAAGFLEGEGSFVTTVTTQLVTAVQENPDPLIRLLEIFGGKVKEESGAGVVQEAERG